jgi:hypothetical protein
MSQEAPGTESITEDGGEQDSTPDRIEDMSDEEILAEGNKDDTLGTGESDSGDDTSDDTDVDDITPDPDDEDVEGDEEGQEDEGAETEEELEDELLSEEEQEIDEVVRKETPEYNDIKKKYPKFFKEFPGMRHTLFRMKAMDRIFTSVDEAKSVAEKHDDLLLLESAVLSGDSEKVLAGLSNLNPEALDKFAENFLPSLYAGARPVHDRITGNVLSTALRVAQQQARSQGNKNLYNAVGHLSQFLFGKAAPPEMARKQSSPELDAQREARSFQDDVTSTGERLLRKELTRGLDPQDVLPDFVKESIIDAAIQKIGAAMDKDEAHLGVINNLWARAQSAGFSKEAKAKLVAAWFGRAKALAGPTRRKLVTSAIEKQQGKGGKTNINRRRHVRTGGKGTSERQGFRPKSAREVDWSKTSDLDILTGKATARKR